MNEVEEKSTIHKCHSYHFFRQLNILNLTYKYNFTFYSNKD